MSTIHQVQDWSTVPRISCFRDYTVISKKAQVHINSLYCHSLEAMCKFPKSSCVQHLLNSLSHLECLETVLHDLDVMSGEVFTVNFLLPCREGRI